MRATILGLATLALGLWAVLASQGAAAQLLVNGNFHAWTDGAPDGWLVTGPVTNAGGASSAGPATLSQTVAAVEGGLYGAALTVSGSGDARIVIAFYDDGFGPETSYDAWRAISGTETLTAGGTAPATTAFAVVKVELTPAGGSLTVAAVSLQETLPVATPTPTPAPLSPTATQTPLPTATAGGSSPVPSPTATKTVTSTPTAKPPTATKTATAQSTATPKPQPTSKPPSTPAPPPPGTTSAGGVAGSDDGSGGLLANGGFEQEADGKPVAWAKYGGTMNSVGGSRTGQRAVSLSSDTSSTKWVHQAAEVTAGGWYEASAWGRIASGTGEVFVRLSFYASSDGSGSAMEQFDSPVSASGGWVQLAVTERAPADARSVRVRLMLRPGGGVTAVFDDARLQETTAPAATATASTTPAGTTQPPTQPTPRPVAATPVPGSSGAGGGTQMTVVQQDGPLSLRISEVMSDPAEPGSDAAYEWVELVNVGTEPVDLAGWQIGDPREMDVLPSLVVPAGGFVVVAAKSAAVPAGVLVARPPDGNIGAGLNNGGDVLRLVAPDGEEVDSVSYGDNTTVFEPPPAAPGPGETIGVRVAGADPSGDNWAVTMRPTPGEANVFLPKSGVTVIPPDATPASGDADGRVVVIEESSNGTSPVVWTVLGAAIASSAVSAGWAGRRHFTKLLDRVRRGR